MRTLFLAAATLLLSFACAAEAAPAAPTRPSAAEIPQAVRAGADRHRADLCPASHASVLQRADLDGDGDADFFQDYGQVAGCTQLSR